MGVVTFSLDIRLVESLKEALPLSVFVETGTFKGDTVASMTPFFDRLITVEFSEPLWKKGVARFKNESKVEVLLGNSPEVLAGIRPILGDKPTLFWLDAHWCIAENTAGNQSQCPLLDEIRAINRLDDTSVILIDDARLFLAPPPEPHEISQWPMLSQIIAALHELSDQHKLMVINDVIAFFPSQAITAMTSYAKRFGTDWLVAANCMEQGGAMMQQLTEKESALQQKEIDIQKFAKALKDKEAIIYELNQAVKAYRSTYGSPITFGVRSFVRFTSILLGRIERILSPRIGNLNQHAPRPWAISDQVKCKIVLGNYPTISVVTPSFGQGCYIEKTLLSVLDQQYPNLEYFVQDGGSKDNTVAVLRKYEGKLTGWISEKDDGQSQAINRGFSNTNGEIMGWLNSDDLLLPETLAIVADYFNRHPDVDVVYGNRLLIDENDMEIGCWILPGHDSDVLSWVDYIPQETLFWRRRIWDNIGGQIDESFRFAMDWDLLVRFRDAGAKFAHIPQFLGAFRIHKHQKTSSAMSEIGYKEMNQIRERLLGRVPGYQEIRKATFSFLLKHVAADIVYRIKIKLRSK